MSRRRSRRSPPLQLRDVAALELDRALGGFEQAHHDAGQRGLAAPGLPHQAERLAGVDLEVDTVDRVHVTDVALEQDALGDREVLLEARDLDQRNLTVRA